jgi:HAE1 family hydrophobic/amphiphilic exporter-1
MSALVRNSLLAFVSLVPAFAQQTVAVGPPGPPLPDLQVVSLSPRVGVIGQTSITLPEVVVRVLANDRDIAVSRILVDEARFNITAAKGYFDPVVGLRAYRNKATTPVASTLGGAANGKLTQLEWNATPQVSGVSQWGGGSYSLNFGNSRLQSNSTFLTLNPQYPTSLSLALTQPLWRGLRIDANRERLQVARKNLQLTTEQLRQRAIEVVTQAVQTYWELVYARQAVEVQTQAVRLAEEQFASNRRQAEQGVLAPIDAVAAQTQVSTFQQNLFLTQQAVTQAENSLKSLMLPNREDILWETELIPETQLNPNVFPPTLGEAVKLALAGRPELAQNALQMQVNRLDQQLAQDQTKPRIDAFANASSAGLVGQPVPAGANPFTGFDPLIGLLNQIAAGSGLQTIPPISFGGGGVPPVLIGSYRQSLSNLVSGNFPTIQVGVQVSLPLHNRTAEAQFATSMAEGRRLHTVHDQIAMLIETDVRNTLQAVNSAAARVQAAAIASRSAEEQYSSEQRQFQAGTSTVFLVLQRQTDFINARLREVRSRADLAEGAAALDRATAQTLETYGITLTP